MTEKEKEIFLNLIIRLCQDETNYINSNFASGDKLYIDGCIDYLNDEEKAVVKKVFFDNTVIDFDEREMH